MKMSLRHNSTLLQLIFFILLFGAGSLWMGQDVNEDLLNYHYYNGYALLHQRMDFDVAPALMQTYLNPFFDAINYLLINLQSPRLTGFILGAVTGLTAFFLCRILLVVCPGLSARQKIIYSVFMLAIGMTGSANISLLGTTTNDNKMCLMIVAAVYCLLTKRNHVLLSGLMLGMVVGFKLVATCYAVGLVLALMLTKNLLYKAGVKYYLFAIGFGFLIANGYWMWMLYSKFHSPLFPFYNNIFHSPYAPWLSFNLPPVPIVHKTFIEYLLLPFYLGWQDNHLISEFIMRDMRIALVFVAAAILFIVKKSKPGPAARLIIYFFMLSYIVWLVLFANYRYALTLEVLSGVLLVYFIRHIFQTESVRLLSLTLLTLVLLATTTYPDWGRTSFGENYFSLQMPLLPQNAEIILTTQPLGYIVPLIKPTHRVIGMPFLQLGEKHQKLYTQTMRSILNDAETKPLYTLSFQVSDNNDSRSLKNLASNGLIQEKSACQRVKTNAGKELKLCPLIKSIPG